MVIEFAEWLALQQEIQAASQAVSGMTAAEAQAALNASATATQSSQLYIYGSQAAQGIKPPIQFPSSTAAQAANSYLSSGGLTTAGGAASSGGSTVQISNMAMTQTAGGATGVAGLLSMNLPTAAAAIAPLAGVALGYGLYSLAPDFWEQISRALLPFCYEDTELMPVVVDATGLTYYPKGAIDAVKDVVKPLESSGMIVSSSAPDIEKWNLPVYYTTGTYCCIAVEESPKPGWSGGKSYGYVKMYTDIPVKFTVWRSDYIYTDKNGNRSMIYSYGIVASSLTRFKFYWTRDSYSETFDPSPDWPSAEHSPEEMSNYGNRPSGSEYEHLPYVTQEEIANSMSIPEVLWDAKKIETIYSPSAPATPAVPAEDLLYKDYQNLSYAMEWDAIPDLPEGVTPWTGSNYPENPQTLDIITSIDGDSVTTEPYYPITTPVGDPPGVSVDPTTTPDITVNPNIDPAVNPWVTPSPSPDTYPDKVPESNPAKLPASLPDYSPDLDPNADPSQEPAPEPVPDPEPAKDNKDSGETPPPSIPILPPVSSGAGLLHVYNPTRAQVDEFGSWLWTTFSGDLIDTLSKLFNDPMDAVIGLHELYATPSVSGTATIRAGYLDSGISSNLVGNRYTSINCGSIVIPEYYGNYLDYSPYTKCFIYLPFVGIVPVSADDIVGNAVNVTYNIDAYNGCCIAIITVAREGYNSTIYQFEGNCGVEIPITSGYNSVLMGGLLGIAGTAISGSPHVGLGLASLGRANLGKNEVSRSGSFSSSYGAMGAKIPYIIVKRPTQKSVVNYNQEYGFPAHKRVKIGACEGYLRVREVHVISPTATDAEKALIETMLKEGVFVK